MEQRQWTHNEMPNGTPSAAAARLGCKCGICRELLKEYLVRYKAAGVPLAGNDDGSAVYHTHKGQPSKTTARNWGCAHPRCLYLAGLYLNEDGVVIDATTDLVDADFGAPKKK